MVQELLIWHLGPSAQKYYATQIEPEFQLQTVQE